MLIHPEAALQANDGWPTYKAAYFTASGILSIPACNNVIQEVRVTLRVTLLP
jgi:hypothetical protein